VVLPGSGLYLGSVSRSTWGARGLVKPLLELFTLGTIADLAPLTGVNRLAKAACATPVTAGWSAGFDSDSWRAGEQRSWGRWEKPQKPSTLV